MDNLVGKSVMRGSGNFVLSGVVKPLSIHKRITLF